MITEQVMKHIFGTERQQLMTGPLLKRRGGRKPFWTSILGDVRKADFR